MSGPAMRRAPLALASLALVSVGLATFTPTTAAAGPRRDPELVRAEGESAPRWMAGLGAGAFTDTGGYGHGGPALVASLPFFFGARRKVFQFGAALDAEGAFDQRHGYLAVGPTALGRIHLGSVYALHLGLGARGGALLGRTRAFGGSPLFFTIENAFRFFPDDRVRLLVGFRVGPVLWGRSDPGNDMGGGVAAFAYAGGELP